MKERRRALNTDSWLRHRHRPPTDERHQIKHIEDVVGCMADARRAASSRSTALRAFLRHLEPYERAALKAGLQEVTTGE
jgi:hypothetical protein